MAGAAEERNRAFWWRRTALQSVRPDSMLSTVRREAFPSFVVLPGPLRSDIEMDEAGSGVVPDAAPAEAYRRVAKGAQADARKPNVDGPSLDVEAVCGDSGPFAPQQGVRGRRTISRDDMERLAHADLRSELVKQIQKAAIDLLHLARAVIAQDVVDFIESGCAIRVVTPVDRVDALVRVCVEEGQAARNAGGGKPGRRGGSRGSSDGRVRVPRRDLRRGRPRSAATARIDRRAEQQTNQQCRAATEQLTAPCVEGCR